MVLHEITVNTEMKHLNIFESANVLSLSILSLQLDFQFPPCYFYSIVDLLEGSEKLYRQNYQSSEWLQYHHRPVPVYHSVQTTFHISLF